MDLLDDICVMDVTYWAPTGPRDRYGKATYANGITIKGRWEEYQDLLVNKAGQEFRTRARCWVRQDLDLDGVLRLGLAENLPPANVDKPFGLEGSYEIQAWSKVPTLEADDFVRIAIM